MSELGRPFGQPALVASPSSPTVSTKGFDQAQEEAFLILYELGTRHGFTLKSYNAPCMTVSTTPSIVAGKLTKAQKRMLLSDRETVLMDRMKRAGRITSLRERLTLGWRGGDLLTPLGVEVHALLHKEEGCG
jgi:hypothetical protein